MDEYRHSAIACITHELDIRRRVVNAASLFSRIDKPPELGSNIREYNIATRLQPPGVQSCSASEAVWPSIPSNDAC
jgi:hypothetical protein